MKKALESLHDAGFVFGDLRPPNVTVVKNDSGNATGARIVDFDWCGKDGLDEYPFLMNRNITWASGMGPRSKMKKSHDDSMLQDLYNRQS